MNAKILYFIILSILFISSCKKEITNNIIEEEEKPALNLKIYGVWQNLSYDPNNDDRKYIEYSTSGYTNEYKLQDNGVQTKKIRVFKVTENLVTTQFGSMATYKIYGDTLILKTNPDLIRKFIKISNLDIVKDWVGTINNLATIKSPNGIANFINGGIGFDAEFLYFAYNRYGTALVYKYNSITDQFVDSIGLGAADLSVFYQKNNNRFIYCRSQNISTLVKSTGFNILLSNASSNTLNSIKNISVNPSSGVIYAYSGSSSELFAGTDGGISTSIFKSGNVPNTNINQMCYYKNDQFLALIDNSLCLVKIDPIFSIVKTYNFISSFAIYNISTDGTTAWINGYNYDTVQFEFRKIILQD